MKYLPNPGKDSVHGQNGKEALPTGSDLSQTHTTLYSVILTLLCVEIDTSQN